MKRRTFLELSGTGILGTLASIDFLDRLPRVTAAEVRAAAPAVQFHPEIEPLVRLLEETPRERIIEEVAQRIRKGTTYREILAALQLAGVRNIQPRPVGFKFHAVLVVNSAHLASLASPDSDRWLPILWAIDQFKSSQAADMREGDWTLAPVDEKTVPSATRAKAALKTALENWDEPAADAAIAGLVRTAGAHEIFELLARYAARDFREIGHKEIYVANSFRTLEAIGWHHAEPILRSLVYALLDRDGAKENPSQAELPADRPGRRNIEAISKIKPGWLEGQPNAEATSKILTALRQASPDDASDLVIDWLNRGASPQSIFDALFQASAELMIRAPGILALHATTFTNAAHYSFTHCRDESTRKYLLLQNAAFLPLFRRQAETGPEIDRLEPAPASNAEASLAEIFTDIDRNRLEAARKILGHLAQAGDPAAFAHATRRLIFLKGDNSHDYKYSSAVLEDYHHLSAPVRDRCLAATAFYLKGAAAPENPLVPRIRAALSA